MPAKERSIRVEGVVLSHREYGEADRFLNIYTRQLGKVRVLAKGVRKVRSRKAGHLEPFTRSTLQLAKGRDLFILTQAESIEPHLRLSGDLVLLASASYIIELVERFTAEEEENIPLYDLLVDSLGRLNRGDDIDIVHRYFEMRLLDYTGFRPQLVNCINCGEEIQPQDQFFSANQGGVLCPRCGPRFPDSYAIRMEALKYLRHFQRSSYKNAQRASLSEGVAREMEYLMHRYLTHQIERGLNTPAFLFRARQDAGDKEIPAPEEESPL